MASGISVESPHQIKELGDAFDIKSKATRNSNTHKPSRSFRKFSRQDSYGNQPVPKAFYGKRRHSFSNSGDCKGLGKKRARPMLPTRFLLGGNICDPLNLGSLADEEINKKLNEVTPQSSPIPTPKHHAQVEVLIPSNINDPLNLKSGDDIHFLPPRPKKRRRHRNKRKKAANVTTPDQSVVSSFSADTKPEMSKTLPGVIQIEGSAEPSMPKPRCHERTHQNLGSKKGGDKIVSPVLPQGSPLKFHRRFHQRSSMSHAGETTDSAASACKSVKSHKWRRQNSKEKPVRFREKDAQFRYGNYNRYYGYRNKGGDDPRLSCMRREWIEGKDVLDIGCNIGHITLSLAHDYNPRKIIGLDIDDNLITIARKNVRHYLTTDLVGERDFPISLALCYGPIVATDLPGRVNEQPKFPNNVFFVQGNYILESDDQLESQSPEFDLILCLSLTKWVHLNWGDEGIRRLFRRAFLQLRPGGRLLLETQPWTSYAKKKKLTETIYKNYHSIKLRPEQFSEYLLSKEVGFSTCELIDTPSHPSKGFMRPLYLFTKASGSSSSSSSSPHQHKEESNTSSAHVLPQQDNRMADDKP